MRIFTREELNHEDIDRAFAQYSPKTTKPCSHSHHSSSDNFLIIVILLLVFFESDGFSLLNKCFNLFTKSPTRATPEAEATTETQAENEAKPEPNLYTEEPTK